ncbi:hypothetical protein N7493_000729 [Penicillium malachiteum]|uniref:GPI anchored serine-threonine rich protein n=1 Tax=Penicillium malachiteum TaxID=1324776 RepID=A0AAD6HX85_9EURO|nr:hypothetical protein N7493_000729 [Penicillium malachiteum]
MRPQLSRIPLMLAISASLVTAQDGTVKCAAQSVVDNCLQTMNFELENCNPGDWDCQCTSSTNIVSCYTNCPDDPDRQPAQQLKQQYCLNAKVYGTMFQTASKVSTATAPWPSISSSSAVDATATNTHAAGETHTDSSATGPTKSLAALQASASPSEGVAAAYSAGSFLAFLGLGLGVML